MRSTIYHPLPDIKRLPDALHAERSVRIELEEGVPVLRATRSVQAYIEWLLSLEREGRLSPQQAEELDRFEDLDDYLSLVNRVVRNLVSTVE